MELQIRLGNSKNNSNKTGGRVEIDHPSFGCGTVLDPSWDDTDSGVVCRQLGFTGRCKPKEELYYGEGTGEILLAYVECTGKEKYIWDCNNAGGWKPGFTYNRFDAGVDCY